MTEMTQITREGEKFLVRGWGGYDGYLEQEFDTIEAALEFERGLWQYT